MDNVRRLQVTLSDGRQLEVLDAGDEHGPAIVQHNGTPTGASLYAPHAADAEAKGLRLVCYGRPGYGRSTRQPGRSVSDAVRDTAEVADRLGIGRFATWGISGGGPHALACAALLPDRVVAAASLASVAPYDADGLDFMAGMGEGNIEEFGATLAGEAELTRLLEAQAPEMLTADPQQTAEQMRSLLGPADQRAFTGELGAFLAQEMQDAVRHGVFGWVDDDLAFARPWGFSLADIRIPVLLWQGTQDKFVPLAHGEWLADHIPGVQAHISSDDGHLTLMHRVPEVHAWLAGHF